MLVINITVLNRVDYCRQRCKSLCTTKVCSMIRNLTQRHAGNLAWYLIVGIDLIIVMRNFIVQLRRQEHKNGREMQISLS